MAATEMALAGGEERWIKRVFSSARQLLEIDTRMALNRRSGLFEGVPRYLLSPASRFPAWMKPVNLLQTTTLAENAAYHAALANLERIAANGKTELKIAYPASALRDAVNSRLWNPSTGNYGAALYGNPEFPVRLQSADNAAQAIAILGGTASEAMASSIASKTPISPYGADILAPRWEGDSVAAAEFPPILLKTLWMAAMSVTSNETAYSAAVAALIASRAKALIATSIDHRRHPELGAVRPIAALVMRGFLGIKFAPEGLYFAPSVPAELQGDKRITGLRYRKALLNISITGTGRALATFTLDGKPSSPFVPAELEGEHEIAITLAGSSSDPGTVSFSAKQTSLPPAPQATWNRPLEARISSASEAGSDDGYAVYIDGILDQITVNDSYALRQPEKLTAVQFAAISTGNLPGFTDEPHLVIPRGWETLINVADHATTGTRLISDKKAAAKVVESNRWKNREITVPFDAPAAGRYIVDIRYSSGLGIVNPHRRTALRRLKVNNVEAGIFVFPQFSPAWWNRDTASDWQLPNSYSTQLCVELQKGVSQLSLAYFQPSPVYVDPFANTVLLDRIRVRRVD